MKKLLTIGSIVIVMLLVASFIPHITRLADSYRISVYMVYLFFVVAFILLLWNLINRIKDI